MITNFMKKTPNRRLVANFVTFLFSIMLLGWPAMASGLSERRPVNPSLICSNASLYGRYAVIGHGFAPTGPPPAVPGPFATVSLFTIDGAGGLTNQVTRSISGAISRGIDTGFYEIGADCTGTLTLITPTAPFPLTFDVVISELSGAKLANEFYFIATSPGGTITATAKRLR